MSELERFKTNIGRALGIPNSIAAQMTPEALVAEAEKLRLRLQSRPRPVGKPKRGALAEYPFEEVVATCEAACAVADAWLKDRQMVLTNAQPDGNWPLMKTLDQLEAVTRTSTLRKARP